MSKRLIAGLGIVVLATLGSGSVAFANHGESDANKGAGIHRNPPGHDHQTGTPGALCVVDGEVTELDTASLTDGGVSLYPRHNHFEFSATTLRCVGQINGIDGVGPHEFAVDASGPADGPYLDGKHGETCAAGWSGYNEPDPKHPYHDANYNISASHGPTGAEAEGLGYFVRVGGHVTTWGHLAGDVNIAYHAELEFQPEAAEATACADATQGGAKITHARLTGAATVLNK